MSESQRRGWGWGQEKIDTVIKKKQVGSVSAACRGWSHGYSFYYVTGYHTFRAEIRARKCSA